MANEKEAGVPQSRVQAPQSQASSHRDMVKPNYHNPEVCQLLLSCLGVNYHQLGGSLSTGCFWEKGQVL